MAEPAFDVNAMGYDYYNDNTARKIKEKPQINPEPKPNLKKVPKEEPKLAEETRRQFARYYLPLALTPIFVVFMIGVCVVLIMAAQQKSNIYNQDIKIQYNETHSEMLRMQNVVEKKITDSVILDYAESELGWVKIPDENYTYANSATENSVIINE